MFVDYENLYSVLTAQSAAGSKTGEFATEILEEVRRYLEEGDDTPTIYGRAYGPFDVLLDTEDSGVPSALHRLGLSPNYVPSAMQGNTSELQLTIDVTRFLTERPDVETLVIVTGDRPYLPLVRTIREEGRQVLVAAVNPPKTNQYDERDRYLDARNLLSQDSREELLANAPDDGAAHSDGTAASPRYDSLTDEAARRAIAITEEHFGQYDEVYLTPLLRKLSDLMGPDQDPKALVSDLEAAGAVRLEKRNGYPYDYTVLIVHDDHPDVQSVHEEQVPTDLDTESAPADPEASAPSSDGSDDPGEAYAPYDHDEFALDHALADEEDQDAASVSDEATPADRPVSPDAGGDDADR
jgi:hypothetical protein